MQVCRALERVGATVFRARSGRTALSQLKQHGIEAAILDVNLGQGETCNEVASDLRTSGIPFCLFSGDLQGADELVSRLDAPLIRKPASNRTLVEGVSRLLEGI
ncbi:hypothetical protein [Palleronia aestuarii]|uniref:hypothetical protein n=1 Tax=Palleronia aestuarii TaxID=568105 RepID=UPI0035717925